MVVETMINIFLCIIFCGIFLIVTTRIFISIYDSHFFSILEYGGTVDNIKRCFVYCMQFVIVATGISILTYVFKVFN